MLVRRTLPHRTLRTVGAWCFLDDYGPDPVRAGPGMVVPPHPHTGLQTVTWLLEGLVRHQDSLGNDLTVRPGQLNLMTAGRGIAHAETSPAARPDRLRGLQLWVAMPDDARDVAPHVEQHAELPLVEGDGIHATVVAGELAGEVSPARTYTPLLGADVSLGPGAAVRLPLDPGHEHAVLALEDGLQVAGRPLPPGSLAYLGRGRRELGLAAGAGRGSRLLLIGGEPFQEQLLMWWNFVARSHEEIVAARQEWEGARTTLGGTARFGAVPGYDGPALAAPPMPGTTLRPRGNPSRAGVPEQATPSA
jgi:redox-sensitive bicupin YhaK (pirin superfamily)